MERNVRSVADGKKRVVDRPRGSRREASTRPLSGKFRFVASFSGIFRKFFGGDISSSQTSVERVRDARIVVIRRSLRHHVSRRSTTSEAVDIARSKPRKPLWDKGLGKSPRGSIHSDVAVHDVGNRAQNDQETRRATT